MRGHMGFRGPVEPEGSRAQVGEFARVDASAHQAARGVRVRLKQVVADLVRDGSTQDDAEALVLHRRRLRQKLPPALVDDSPGPDR